MNRCAVRDGDTFCLQPADTFGPIALCAQHSLRVAAALLPRVMRGAVSALAEAAEDAADDWATTTDLVDNAVPLAVEDCMAGGHDPIVYVIGNGPRVKIGTTRHLRRRVSSLSLRRENVICALQGDRRLERALHRTFFVDRVGSTEWFKPSEDLIAYIKTKTDAAPEALKVPVAPVPVIPQQAAGPRFPDGSLVGDAWPDLYRTFQEMGSATKKELAAECQISRDTAMRAIEAWLKHGVQQKRDGRSTRYYLPDTVNLTKEN